MADPAACLLLALEINLGLKALLPMLHPKLNDSALSGCLKVCMQLLYVS